MYLLIRHPAGIIVEAVMLANRKNRMRVIAADFPDAIELRRSGTEWFTATGEPVELDFMMPIAMTPIAHSGDGVSASKTARFAPAAG